MTAINPVTDFSKDGEIGIITLNSPPVNALSSGVRDGLYEGFKAAIADPSVKAIVLICEGRTFIAGADISEFGGAQKGASLFDVQAMMEDSPKPVVAAIHGTALGGGLEVALCAHYRVAVPSARCGLPEVNLGLLPGAGGTQRLPRIAGVEKALEMVTSGMHVPARECLEMGLVDALADEGKLKEKAVAFARQILAEKKPLKKVRENNAKLEAAKGHPEIFANFRKANARKFRGFKAPEANIQCIEAAVNQQLRRRPEDRAQAVHGRHDERRIRRRSATTSSPSAWRTRFRTCRTTPTLIPIKKVGIIGAGTMGGGIAMNFVNAGIAVTIVEVKQEALDRGLKVVRGNYERSAKNGRLPESEVDKRMGLITGSLNMEDFKDCDLVIEAVFERMDIKKDIFTKLDAICKPGAILATNTSGLNIDEIASVTKRPEVGHRPALLLAGQRDEAAGDRARRPHLQGGDRHLDEARQDDRQDRRSGRASARALSATASWAHAAARRRRWCSKVRCLGMSTACSTISASRWDRSR